MLPYQNNLEWVKMPLGFMQTLSFVDCPNTYLSPSLIEVGAYTLNLADRYRPGHALIMGGRPLPDFSLWGSNSYWFDGARFTLMGPIGVDPALVPTYGAVTTGYVFNNSGHCAVGTGHMFDIAYESFQTSPGGCFFQTGVTQNALLFDGVSSFSFISPNVTGLYQRIQTGKIAYKGNLYTYGGKARNSNTVLGDGWIAPKEALGGWTQFSTALPWGLAYGMITDYWNGQVLVAGGSTGSAIFPGVWLSSDGENFTQVGTLPTGFATVSNYAALGGVWNSILLMVDAANILWATHDLIHWVPWVDFTLIPGCGLNQSVSLGYSSFFILNNCVYFGWCANVAGTSMLQCPSFGFARLALLPNLVNHMGIPNFNYARSIPIGMYPR